MCARQNVIPINALAKYFGTPRGSAGCVYRIFGRTGIACASVRVIGSKGRSSSR